MTSTPTSGTRRVRVTEWWCVLTLRALAASFLVVGTLFFVFPDGTVRVMNAVGSALGNFPPAPASALRFWLSLSTGYMALVTALAYLAQRDLRQRRDLVMLLALGKGVSSLTCLGFYWWSLGAFIYLANFLVDGSITLMALAIWSAVPSLNATAQPAAAPPAFAALLEAMIPAGGAFPEGADGTALAKELETFAAGAGASVPAALRLAVRSGTDAPAPARPLRLFGQGHSRPRPSESARWNHGLEQRRDTAVQRSGCHSHSGSRRAHDVMLHQREVRSR